MNKVVFKKYWYEFECVNCHKHFRTLQKNADEDLTQSWLSVGLTLIDLTLIIFLFLRGI